MPPVSIGELFGNYIIIVNKADAVLMALVYFALLMSIPFLANLPQPTPRWVK